MLAACRDLERHHGFRVTYLPVDGHGRVDPAPPHSLGRWTTETEIDQAAAILAAAHQRA